ncbi:MAG TPA: FGGY family carbohydrate kinase [Thermoleophilaceae bacterium]
MRDLLLGIDVGTSVSKAAVVDADGRELAHGEAPTPWQRVETGAETDPQVLFDAALAAARGALANAPEGRVRGVGVTSMAEAGVLLDARGEVLAPTIVWHDTRGEEEAARIAADFGPERFAERTGLPATALCTLAKLRWLVHHRPETRAGARWFNVAEWVAHRLGARHVSELSLTSRTGLLDLSTKAPFHEAFEWVGLPEELQGELVLAGTPIGTVDVSALPEAAGAALTVGGHDHLCAGVGAGVVDPGDVLDSSGTAEALVRVAAPLDADQVRRSVAGGVTVGWHAVEGRHALLGAVWSGLALTEVLGALGVTDAERDALDSAAMALPPSDVPEIPLDLYSFERPPLELPEDLPAAAIWRGAIESAVSGVERVLAHIEDIAGPRGRIVSTGGWSRERAVMAAKDRIGRFETPAVVQAGARGAALLGGVAAGLYESADTLPPIPTLAAAERS